MLRQWSWYGYYEHISFRNLRIFLRIASTFYFLAILRLLLHFNATTIKSRDKGIRSRRDLTLVRVVKVVYLDIVVVIDDSIIRHTFMMNQLRLAEYSTHRPDWASSLKSWRTPWGTLPWILNQMLRCYILQSIWPNYLRLRVYIIESSVLILTSSAYLLNLLLSLKVVLKQKFS